MASFAAYRAEGMIIQGGELPALVDYAERACLSSGLVFQRAGILSEVIRVPEDSPLNAEAKLRRDTPVIKAATTHRLREIATKYGTWSRRDQRQKTDRRIDCPLDVVHALEARGSWSFDVLRGIVSIPTITADGRLIAESGFDRETGLFAMLDEYLWRGVRDIAMTREAAIAARLRLEDLVSEFPFANDAAKSAWLAELITSLIRWRLDHAPMFLHDAPAAGSGKTLLAHLVGVLIYGDELAAQTLPERREEQEKLILALLMAGVSVVLIDNIETALGGQGWCAAVTSKQFTGRVLGASRVVTVPTRCLWIVSGTNIAVRGDVWRRVLVVRIEPGVEQPEARRFRRANLLQFARQYRAELVAAGLTILGAYVRAGRPDCGLSNWGSFEEWCSEVRAALVWSGAADPCETRERVQAVDTDREELSELLSSWRERYCGKEVLIRELVADVTSAGDEAARLREAVHVVAHDGTRINTRRLGKRVARWEGRVAEGLRFVRGIVAHKTQSWRVEMVGGLTGIGGLSSAITGNCRTNTVEQHETKITNPLNPRVQQAISEACNGLQLSPAQLAERLSQADIADLESGKTTAQDLRLFAETFDQERA